MIDVEYSFNGSVRDVAEIGSWLDQNMPNPPLPDAQRWTLGVSADGRYGIQFANDHDATLFLLRWPKQTAR